MSDLPMKVLHLVAGGLSGGAARGAYWLHKAQLEIGIDSTLFNSGHDNLGDESVVALGASVGNRIKFSLLNRLGKQPQKLYRKRKRWVFSTGFTGVDFTKLPAYQQADLIHLHWINGLVSMRTLRKVKKPIVWTMRDMWPMTGGCHYALGCERYIIGCGECPQLQSKYSLDLSKLIVENKITSLPKHLRVVGISQWLSECAQSSRILANYPVQTISNNIDTRTFSPIAPDVARQALGLSANKKLILVGAQSVTDFYKGFDLFLEAMYRLNRQDVHVVTFGRDAGSSLATLDIGHTDLGLLSDTLSLRLAYAAADVFVAPSLMDAFGKTLAEAQACATPVVCFDATGPKDIVEHQVTGYKAQPFEPSDLAAGIHWVLDQPISRHKEMRTRSRKRAVELFDARIIAQKYKALYEEMLT